MKVVVCVDDNYGILFNKRRVSKDSEIIKDINENISNINIKCFSEKLFDKNYTIVEKYTSDYNFIEEDSLEKMEDIVTEVIIYYFNRRYPSDLKLKLNLEKYTLINEYDFIGSSHEKITKKIYRSSK